MKQFFPLFSCMKLFYLLQDLFPFYVFLNLSFRVCLLRLFLVISKSCRSSCPEVFCEKGVLRNFTKFTGKHLCQSLFFSKVAGLRPVTLLKKTLAQLFSCEFCEIFKNAFFIEHLWWLLLKLQCLLFFRYESRAM